MSEINGRLNSQLAENGQQDDGLSQDNPSPAAEIVRRGQEAMARQRRAWEDWVAIAEALRVGRADVMREVHANQPTGKRYEKAMAEWLIAHSFHVIDKGARNRLLECLQHRNEIEKWRSRLTDAERFRFNHPNTVFRKWKAATVVPEPNAPPKTSAFAKLKAAHIEVQEELHRAKREIARGGGDLWTPDDTDENILRVLEEKFPPNRGERLARKWLKKYTDKKVGVCARSERPAKQIDAGI